MKILDIHCFKILSSLGHFTLQASCTFEDESTITVGVPYGISAGKYEVVNVPAEEAIEEIEKIKTELVGIDFTQESLDQKLIELSLSGNSSLAISACFFKKANVVPQDLKFPKLMTLLFEGGKHGNPSISFQEFMIIEDSLRGAVSDYQKLREHLLKNHIETTVGAEGGFSPVSFTNEKILETISSIFPDKQFALDVAGSFQNGLQDFESLLHQYNIYSLEDPFSDEEWDKWTELTGKNGRDKLIVGDDLTVTNSNRIQTAVEKKAINAVVIKPNQNGTITGAKNAARIAHENGLKVVVSHRGEETNDSWIIDFALMVEADYVKFGGINRGERIAKYNRLLELGMT